MDDFTLYYDDEPRNAPSFGFGMPMMRPQPPPRRPVIATATPPTRVAMAPGGYAVRVPAAQAPAYATPVYPAPTYVPPGYAPRRTLRDMSVAELLPLAAQVFAALRPLPGAPAELPPTDINTNVTNQTKFLAAIATHFKTDTQLTAAGTVIAKLVG